MEKKELKDKVCDAIDQHRDKIIDIGNRIFENPELGFKEYKTAALVEEVFSQLKLPVKNKLALTGSKAVLKGRERKAVVAVMGELDAVLCPEHPHADVETGAAHSCGHNAQIAGMLGAAMGLTAAGIQEHLSGDVVFFAVPAEESGEVEFRQRLREKGILEFLGGKQELIRIGALDDVDMTIMFHTTVKKDNFSVKVGGTSNGKTVKFIRYRGKEAHAGSAPHNGVNALNAAMLGIMGIHAQRETFTEEECIRVHPIITKGGDLVNIVPADVRIETYVRGKTMEGVVDASSKVNRALKAGALAVGAEVEIAEIPGYMPRFNHEGLTEIFRRNAVDLLGEENVGEGKHGTGCSDIGDVMHIMPAIHPYFAGAEGRGHTCDYRIADEELAYILPAKAMAMTVIDLLACNAAAALEVKRSFPRKTKEEFLAMWKENLGQLE